MKKVIFGITWAMNGEEYLMNFNDFKKIISRVIERHVNDILTMTTDIKAPLKMYELLIHNFQESLELREQLSRKRKEKELSFECNMESILDNCGEAEVGNVAEELIGMIVKEIRDEFKEAIGEESKNKLSIH